MTVRTGSRNPWRVISVAMAVAAVVCSVGGVGPAHADVDFHRAALPARSNSQCGPVEGCQDLDHGRHRVAFFNDYFSLIRGGKIRTGAGPSFAMAMGGNGRADATV